MRHDRIIIPSSILCLNKHRMLDRALRFSGHNWRELFVSVEVFIWRLNVTSAGAVGETSRKDASIFGEMEAMDGGTMSMASRVRNGQEKLSASGPSAPFS